MPTKTIDEIQDHNLSPIQRQSLTCFDSEQLSDLLEGGDYELHQLDAGSFQADLFNTSFEKGVFDKGYYNRAILTEGTFSSEFMTFGCILDAKGASQFNAFSVKVHDTILIDEGSPFDFHTAADTIWTSFQFKREDLLKLGVHLSTPNHDVHYINPGTDHNNALKLGEILNYLENLDPLHTSYLNSEMLYNHMLSLYAQTMTQSQSPKLLKRNESTLLAKKIYQYLNDHPDEPVQMIDLTDLTGKSERTVERIFKRQFGVAPYTYFKLHRLNLIRKQLMKNKDSTSTSITHIVMQNGFMNIAYFGKEYKKLFGETPSETLGKI